MTIEQLVKELKLFTVSGNDIPVDRCTVKAKDLALVLETHEQLMDTLFGITTAIMCEGEEDSWAMRETGKANSLLSKIIEEEIKE